MTEQENLKDIIKKEYLKCAMDPVHFAKKYCYITHPQRGRILFHLYPFQEEVLEAFKTNNNNIINKGRQLGISTLAALYTLHMMIFSSNKNILVIATKEKTAKNMVTKVRFMYDNLPSWLKGNQKPLEANKLSLKLANGSQVIAVAASGDAGRSEAVSWLVMDEAAFISNIDTIYTSIKPTLATGGGILALSSPNGIGNWFHKTCEKAELGTGSEDEEKFNYIELPWQVHPERDEKWERKERANMSDRDFAQEYACDFAGSAHTLVAKASLDFYENTYICDPLEKRFLGGDFWIWGYPDYNRNYMVVADVARGDGSDYSAFHVIDIEACEQVAEFNSQIGTREYGHMLVSVATEYNNALLVVENANIGWDVVQTILEREYVNTYYSPRSHGDMSMDKYLDKMESDNLVPGFSNTSRTRPLVISKMESYIKDNGFIFHSIRLLKQLRVFEWKNGKAQAKNGYNDDMVMAAGIGLFVRDTALKYTTAGSELAQAAVSGFSKSSYEEIYPTQNHSYISNNPFGQQMSHGYEDFKWLLGN